MYRARFVRPEPGMFRIDFDRAIDDRPTHAASAVSPEAGLAVNIWEEGDQLILEAAVPGYPVEALDITIRDSRLVLQAAPAAEPEGRAYLLQERASLGFERRLRLPYPIDAEAVKAVVKDGILTLTLPKAATARAHKVPVRVEEPATATTELP